MGGAGMRGGGLAPRGAPEGAALDGGSNEYERGVTERLKPPGPRGPCGKPVKIQNMCSVPTLVSLIHLGLV